MQCAEDLQRGWSDMCLLLDRWELDTPARHDGDCLLGLWILSGSQPGTGNDRPERTEVRAALVTASEPHVAVCGVVSGDPRMAMAG